MDNRQWTGTSLNLQEYNRGDAETLRKWTITHCLLLSVSASLRLRGYKRT